jgi:helix-turn-helix protein
MSESVVADFIAKFSSESTARGSPAKGRVVLSQKRLVLAANDEEKVTIPLSSLFDIAVGHVPDSLDGFFDATVTIAFERNGNRYVAAIEAGEDKIDKFSTVLFKAVLNGTDVTMKHPALLGGRVTDQELVPARLFLEPQSVRFKKHDGTVDIDLSRVTEFSRDSREIKGKKAPVLEVRHMKNGQSMLSVVAIDSPRKLSILGRYLRLEYSELIADLEDIEIKDSEKELLVALYSGADGDGMSLANVLDEDATKVTMLLNRLEENGLVTDTTQGTSLTPKGQVVVSNHLEDVNA